MALTGDHFIGMSEAGNYPDPLAVYDRLLPADEVVQPHQCVPECDPEFPEGGAELSTERMKTILRVLGVEPTWSEDPWKANDPVAARILASAALIGVGEKLLFEPLRNLPPESAVTNRLVSDAHEVHRAAGGWTTPEELTDALLFRLIYVMRGVGEIYDADGFSELSRTLMSAVNQMLAAGMQILNGVIEFEMGHMDKVAAALRGADKILQSVQPAMEFLADEIDMR